jgi:hypothetical protein
MQVDAGSPKEIQGKYALEEHFVPKVEGKVAVGGAQSSNEMIFKGANCSLCGIAAMSVCSG